MNSAKDDAVASISRAQNELAMALEQLEQLPAFDVDSVGLAAHALNNYLSVVDGIAEVLQASLQQSSNKQLLNWVEGLLHTSELMTHTVHQLMNMSASDSHAFKFGDVNLPLLADRVCVYYRRIASRKQIAINFQNTVGKASVWADRIAVAAVLDNLLSNAVKYSPHGKTVHVEVKTDGATLVCQVRDEGPGISPADHAKLFQRGVRLSATPTGGEPSTGYGLAVASDLMTKIGGEIGYEDAPGGGSCFSIRLPIVS